MEVALTFGSLGDIIQLCQLAIQLSRAVGVGCGAVGESTKEYQELRHDLDFFVRILIQVVETYQERKSSPYLEGLNHASKSVVDQTVSLIQEALNHFQSRYKNSLLPGGSGKSGKKLQDVYKKVEWSTREKERVRGLREKLQESVQRLSLLTSLVTTRSARVDNTTLLARVAEVQDLVSKSCSNQEEILGLMRQQRKSSEEQAQKLDEVNRQLVKQDTSSRSILAVTGEALSAILQVKDLLVQVSQDVINVRVVLNSTFLRSMDPTKELPAIIEDPLGRRVPIPPEWLGSLDWEALYALLSCQLKGQNGHDMVRRRAFALEESASGRDLNPEQPLHLCLRRGMKINMTMLFRTAEPLSCACPRCGTETNVLENATVQCPRSDCGMWFRMQQIMVGESDLKASLKDGESTISGMADVTSTPAKPADFQRVRLFCHDANVTVPETGRGGRKPPYVWLCCNCGIGWFSLALDPVCLTCSVRRCGRCIYAAG